MAPGGGTAVDGALLFATLSDLTLAAGDGAFGLAVSSGGAGSIVLAAVSAGTDRWIGVEVSGITASIAFGDVVSVTVGTVNLSFNEASDGATPLDFVDDLIGDSLPAGFDPNADAFAFSGTNAAVSLLDGMATGIAATFSLTSSTVDVDLGAPADDLTGASLFTLVLTDVDFAIGSAGAGLTVTDGDITVAALRAPGADTRRWIAVSATNLAAGLTVPGVELTVGDASIEVNRGLGGAAPLNWTTAITGAPVAFTGERNAVSLTVTALSLADGLVTGTGTIAVASATVDADPDGAAATGDEVVGGRLLTVTLTAFTLDVGQGVATITSGPTGALTIASLRPAATAPVGDTRSWLAVQGTGLQAALNIPGVGVSVTSAGLAINRASGAFDGTNATPLDWTAVEGAGVTLTDATTAVLGTATVTVTGVLTGAATFALTFREVAVDADPARLTTLTLSDFTLNLLGGLANVSSGDAGTLTVASLAPTDTADARSWLGIQGSGLSGTLSDPALGSLTVTALSVAVNRASGTGATPLDWAADVPAAGLTLAGDATTIGGRAAFSFVDGFLAGAATFAWSRQAVSVRPSETAEVVAGHLTRLALSDLALTAGSPGFGVVLAPGGTIDVAIVATATDTWTGILAQDIAGSIALGDLASVSASALDIAINRASGATPLNFATGVDLTPSEPFTATPITGAGGTAFAVPGALAITASGVQVDLLDGLVTGTADIAYASSTIASGAHTGERLVTLALSAFSVSVGDGLATITSGSAGTLKVAALRPPVAAGDTRGWLGIEGTGLAGTLTVPGVSTISITGAAIAVNRASGAATPGGATPATIDWTTVPGSGLTLVATPITSVSGTLAAFTLAGGVLSITSAQFSLVSTRVDVDPDGNTTTADELVAGRLGTLTLRSFSASFGGVATISTTTGFLTVASLSSADPADTRRWLGIEASGLSGSLSVPGVTGTASGLGLRINTASGAVDGLEAEVIDWAARLPQTGLTLTDGTTTLLGTLNLLSIADGLLTGSANFAVTRQDVAVLPDAAAPAVGAVLSRITLTQLALSVGSADFGVTLGQGGTLEVAVVRTGETTARTLDRHRRPGPRRDDDARQPGHARRRRARPGDQPPRRGHHRRARLPQRDRPRPGRLDLHARPARAGRRLAVRSGPGRLAHRHRRHLQPARRPAHRRREHRDHPRDDLGQAGLGGRGERDAADGQPHRPDARREQRGARGHDHERRRRDRRRGGHHDADERHAAALARRRRLGPQRLGGAGRRRLGHRREPRADRQPGLAGRRRPRLRHRARPQRRRRLRRGGRRPLAGRRRAVRADARARCR